MEDDATIVDVRHGIDELHVIPIVEIVSVEA